MNNLRNAKKNIKINTFSGGNKESEDDKENIIYEGYDNIMNKKLNCNYILNITEKDREFGKDLTNMVHHYRESGVVITNGNSLGKNNCNGPEKVNKRTLSNVFISVNSGQQGNTSILKNFFKKETAPKLNIPNPNHSIKFIPNHPNTSKNRDVSINPSNFFSSSNTNQIHTTTNQYDKNLKINSFIRQKKNTNFNLEFPVPHNNVSNILNNNNIELNTVNIIQKNALKNSKISGMKPGNYAYEDGEANKINSYMKNNSQCKERNLSKIKLNKNRSVSRRKVELNGHDKENTDINICDANLGLHGQYKGTESVSTANGTASIHSQYNTFNNFTIEIPPNGYLITDDFFDEIENNINKENINQKNEEVVNKNIQLIVEKKEAKPEVIYDNFITKENSMDIPANYNPEAKYAINDEILEYAEEIFSNLKEEEFSDRTIQYGYMFSQKEINEQMRAILIDWLIEVHSKFLLRPETLFITVMLIDKYLSLKPILRTNLQLLGVCSMLIACKHEEIFSPHVRDFVYITDKAYTKEEVLEMEEDILKTLQFKILSPTSLRFLEMIAVFFKFNMKQYMFGRYLLEISLIDYRMTKYSPSIIACTAAYITMKYFHFSNYHLIYSNYFCSGANPNLIKDCAREICFLIDNSNDSSLSAAKRKFSKKEYFEVSNLHF